MRKLITNKNMNETVLIPDFSFIVQIQRISPKNKEHNIVYFWDSLSTVFRDTS